MASHGWMNGGKLVGDLAGGRFGDGVRDRIRRFTGLYLHLRRLEVPGAQHAHRPRLYILFRGWWLSVELHILCSDCANHVVLITRLKRVVSPVGCAPREGPRRGPDFGAPVTRSLWVKLCSPCSRVLCSRSSERSTLMCDFRGNSGQTHAYTDIKTEHSHRSTMTHT